MARAAVAAFGLLCVAAGCGGGEERPACFSTAPGQDALYANDDVAFGWPAGAPEGSELESAPHEDGLWFAKTGLYVRGNGTVVVRVPPAQSEQVRIANWIGPSSDGELRSAVLVETDVACESDWTAYPGGLVFEGRHCVRLRVEGPENEVGSALIGLRKDCSG